MKHFFYLFIIIILASCQSNSSHFRISGNIAGLDTGMVYLIKAKANDILMVDTAEIKGGKFFFEGEAITPAELHFLRLNERELLARFFLEPGKTNVKAYADSLNATKVTGSDETDVLNIFLGEVEYLTKRVNEYQTQYSQARSTDEADRIRIDYEASINNMTIYVKNFVKENINSPVALYLLLTQLAPRIEYEELKEIADKVPAELSESPYYKELNEILKRTGKISIGAVAPDFTMNDQNGNPVTLSSLRGKYLLIDFWASWCVPCRQENPNIVTAYAKYKDKGFEILGVSLDQTKDAWLKAIADDNLGWLHVSDLRYWQNAVARLYEVNSIPLSLLLDKDGKIIARNLRGDKLDATLSKLLN